MSGLKSGVDLLSHPQQGSTISAKRLNDRVRNETGCDPLTMTTTETNNTHNHHPTHRATATSAKLREHMRASNQLSAADKPSAY